MATGSKQGNYFAWWQQPAERGAPWRKTVLPGSHPGATNVLIADLHRDGAADLVGACGHGRGVVLLRGPRHQGNPIDDSLEGTHALAMHDLGGDGDLDLAVGSTVSRVLTWFENDGKANFRRWTVDGDSRQSAYDIRVVDMDGDRDPDLLVAGQDSLNVVWYEATGGPRH